MLGLLGLRGYLDRVWDDALTAFHKAASEIEVRFTADGPGQTTVELEHRLIERLAGGQAIHDAIRGGGGWAAILELFAKATADTE